MPPPRALPSCLVALSRPIHLERHLGRRTMRQRRRRRVHRLELHQCQWALRRGHRPTNPADPNRRRMFVVRSLPNASPTVHRPRMARARERLRTRRSANFDVPSTPSRPAPLLGEVACVDRSGDPPEPSDERHPTTPSFPWPRSSSHPDQKSARLRRPVRIRLLVRHRRPVQIRRRIVRPQDRRRLLSDGDDPPCSFAARRRHHDRPPVTAR